MKKKKKKRGKLLTKDGIEDSYSSILISFFTKVCLIAIYFDRQNSESTPRIILPPSRLVRFPCLVVISALGMV